MKVFFGGDFYLGGDLLNKSANNVIKIDEFLNAGLRIINLEQPISDNNEIADKSTLYTGSNAVIQLKQLKIDAVNIAHNHIQDKGINGIVETVQHLNLAKIGVFGAGKNLEAAGQPYWITDDLCIFGYCQYAKPYLKQIIVATDECPGVNPLTRDKILHDVEKLPTGKKAILYFHWGREHVWFPPRESINIAKELLMHPNIALIIGMHPHRLQGFIEYNGKRAYMSLGNFLFPNFYISPPTQIINPVNPGKVDITRQYHSVKKLTYKKWRLVNRLSMFIVFETETGKIKHGFSFQKDNEPIVEKIDLLTTIFIKLGIKLLALLYNLPCKIYKIIEFISTLITNYNWRLQIYLFKARQLGYKTTINFIIKRISNLI